MDRQMSRHSQLYSVTSPSGGHRIIKLYVQPSAQAHCYIREARGGGERVERGTESFQEYSRREFNQRSALILNP